MERPWLRQALIFCMLQEGMGPEVGMTLGLPAGRLIRLMIESMLLTLDKSLSRFKFPEADVLLWQFLQFSLIIPFISAV